MSRAAAAGRRGRHAGQARAARRKAPAALSPQAVTALQAALAAEQAASYGYGVVGAHLNASSAQSVSADADWVAHQQARDSLTAMITIGGGHAGPGPGCLSAARACPDSG